MSYFTSPQDPLAPSDWLSSLHVGVTWKNGVNFSEKKMMTMFKENKAC